MDEIYKILIAAAVGFALSPLSELLKRKIETKQSKNRLIEKLEQSLDIIDPAIIGLNNSALAHEQNIYNQSYAEKQFRIPFLRLPKIDEEFEKSYQSLSKKQRTSISIVLQGVHYAEDSIKNLINLTVDFSNLQNEYNREPSPENTSRLKHSYAQILQKEQSLINILISIRHNLKISISDKQSSLTDSEVVLSTSEELGVLIKLSWWPHLDSKKPKVNPET